MTDWGHLTGRAVTVYALGITYRGRVVEMGEASLLLKAEGGFREIPWDQITRIEETDLGAEIGAVRSGRDTPPEDGA